MTDREEVLGPEGKRYASVDDVLAALGPALRGPWERDASLPVPCTHGDLVRDSAVATARVGFADFGSFADDDLRLQAERTISASPAWFVRARAQLLAGLYSSETAPAGEPGHPEPFGVEEQALVRPILHPAGEPGPARPIGPFTTRVEAAKALGVDRTTMRTRCKEAAAAGFHDRTDVDGVHVAWETYAELSAWWAEVQDQAGKARRSGFRVKAK